MIPTDASLSDSYTRMIAVVFHSRISFGPPGWILKESFINYANSLYNCIQPSYSFNHHNCIYRSYLMVNIKQPLAHYEATHMIGVVFLVWLKQSEIILIIFTCSCVNFPGKCVQSLCSADMNAHWTPVRSFYLTLRKLYFLSH